MQLKYAVKFVRNLQAQKDMKIQQRSAPVILYARAFLGACFSSYIPPCFYISSNKNDCCYYRMGKKNQLFTMLVFLFFSNKEDSAQSHSHGEHIGTCVRVRAQLRLTLYNPVGCSLLGFSVHGILQARMLDWVAISSSRGSSRPRNGTCVSCIFCIDRPILYHCTTWEAHWNGNQ